MQAVKWTVRPSTFILVQAADQVWVAVGPILGLRDFIESPDILGDGLKSHAAIGGGRMNPHSVVHEPVINAFAVEADIISAIDA